MSEGAAVWRSTELAKVYLEGVRGAIPLAQEQIDVMLRVIEASGLAVRRVLDLGCGDGILSRAVVARHPGAQSVLLDFNEEMLRAARTKFEGLDAQFIAADYGKPGWTAQVTGPFDAIVSGFSIHHQPDDRKKGIYRELFDLLAPGAIFVNVEHVASATPWVGRANDQLFIDHLHRRRPAEPREEIAAKYYYRPDKSANILAMVEDQCAWLREIGYVDVDCYLKVFEMAVFGGRRA